VIVRNPWPPTSLFWWRVLAPAHFCARGAPPRNPQARDCEPCFGIGGGHRFAVLCSRHMDCRRAHPCLRDPDPGGAPQADER